MHAARPLAVVSRFFAALLFLGFVIEQAPHTVHHLFESEQAWAECLLSTAGERLPGLGSEVIGLGHGLAWEPAEHHPAPSRLPGILIRSAQARAPPLLASSLA